MTSAKKKLLILIGLTVLMLLLWLRQFIPQPDKVNKLNQLSDANLESVRQFETILNKFYSSDTSSALFRDTLWLNVNLQQPVRNPFVLVSRPLAQSVNVKTRPTIKNTAPKPVDTKPHPQPKFKLDGIIFDRRHSHAIVNATVVQVGDTLNGYRVTEITLNSVRLEGPGGTVSLNLPEENLK